MNAVVFRTTLRGSTKGIVSTTAGLGVFFYLVLLSSAAFVEDLAGTPLFRDPPRALEAFLGGSANFSEASGWLVIGLTHPVVLAIQTAGALMVSAGAVATELERGSLDLVLTRPVRRSAYLSAKLAASLVVVTVVQVGGVAGVLLARATIPEVAEVGVGDVLVTFLGAWVLFAAFACVATFVSASSSLRSRAVGAGVAIVVISFFANFVALLFDEVEALRFATPFHYFRPGDLMEGQGMTDLLALAGLGIVFAAFALRRFARRDLTR